MSVIMLDKCFRKRLENNVQVFGCPNGVCSIMKKWKPSQPPTPRHHLEKVSPQNSAQTSRYVREASDRFERVTEFSR